MLQDTNIAATLADNTITSEQPNRLPLDQIVPSLSNPRKTFDFIEQLAADIKTHGILQPVLLRPLPASRLEETSGLPVRPGYEIIAGERRYRAAQLAGLETIPVFVRTDLGDVEVLTAQLVENDPNMRRDLHPLEEAAGYQHLVDSAGVRKEDIAAMVNRGRTYVYNRLKLLDLTPEARQAFRDGKLDASKAELLATVADPKLQLKALKEFTEVLYQDCQKSYRELRDWLQQNVLLRIKDAPFDTQDAMLLVNCKNPALQGATACSACPKRTHADRDLFAAFDGPDMCTDAPCYRAKEEAHMDAIRAEGEAKGMQVIVGKDAKKLRPNQYSDNIKGYVRLDAKHADGKGGEATINKLIGKDGPAPVLFVDPHTHKPVKVLPLDVVGELLKKKGLVTETTGERDKKREAAEAREKAKRDMDREWRARSIVALADAVRAGKVTHFSAGLLRALLARLIDSNWTTADQDQQLLGMWGLPEVPGEGGWSHAREVTKALERHVQAAEDEALGPMVLQYLLFSDAQPRHDYGNAEDTSTPTFDALSVDTGVDLEAIRKEVQAEHKAAAKAAKAPPPGATVQAAPQGSDAQDPGASSDKPSKHPAGRRRKLSTQEAQSGIADAMQKMDGPGGADEEDVDQAGFKVGDQVKIKEGIEGYGGQSGEITGRLGSNMSSMWNVKLQGERKALGFVSSSLEPLGDTDQGTLQLDHPTGNDECGTPVDIWAPAMGQRCKIVHVHHAAMKADLGKLVIVTRVGSVDTGNYWAKPDRPPVLKKKRSGHVVDDTPGIETLYSSTQLQRVTVGEGLPTFNAGDLVKVNATVTSTKLKKWIGQEAVVLGMVGDGACSVSFGKKRGGANVTFDRSELEVMHG